MTAYSWLHHLRTTLEVAKSINQKKLELPVDTLWELLELAEKACAGK